MALSKQCQTVDILRVDLKKYSLFNHYVLDNLDGHRFKRFTPFGIEPGDALAEVNFHDVRSLDEKQLRKKLCEDDWLTSHISITVIKNGSSRFHDLFLESPNERVCIVGNSVQNKQ